MALKVGELYAELGIKDNKFVTGIASAEKGFNGLQKKLANFKDMDPGKRMTFGMAAAGGAAMAAGVVDRLWEVSDLVAAWEAAERQQIAA